MKLNKNIIEYVTILLWVLLNGSALELIFGNIYIPLVFVVFVCIFLVLNKKIKIRKHNVLVFVSFFAIYIINFLIYHTQCRGPMQYVVVLFMFSCSFLFSEIMTKNNFIKKFVNVMAIIAISSIVMHIIAFFIPIYEYAIRKPNTLHMLVGLHNYWGFSQGRNSGPFWEPGAFQIFLNLALYFDIYMLKDTKKSNWLKIRKVFLIVGIISTVSTTGYIILLIIIIPSLFKILKKFKYISTKIVILVICFIISSGVMVLTYNSDAVQKKFFEKNMSREIRYNDLEGSIELLSEIPLYGTGVNTHLRDSFYLSKGISPNSNSVGVLASTINYGIPYIIIYIYLIIKNILRDKKRINIILIAMLILIVFSESIFEYPIMYMFLFRFKDQKKEVCQNK